MLKSLTASVLLLSSIFFVESSFHLHGDIQVKLAIIDSIKSEGFLLRTEIKNISKRPLTVLTERSWDYKREQINTIGNYIFELERRVGKKFETFPPSADIDFMFSPAEYMQVASSAIIADTFYVAGSSCSFI